MNIPAPGLEIKNVWRNRPLLIMNSPKFKHAIDRADAFLFKPVRRMLQQCLRVTRGMNSGRFIA
jgi:hypothetical protein